MVNSGLNLGQSLVNRTKSRPRIGYMHDECVLYNGAKLTNFYLESRPKQLKGYHPLAVALPALTADIRIG
jgi:hypothetical protein